MCSSSEPSSDGDVLSTHGGNSDALVLTKNRLKRSKEKLWKTGRGRRELGEDFLEIGGISFKEREEDGWATARID